MSYFYNYFFLASRTFPFCLRLASEFMFPVCCFHFFRVSVFTAFSLYLSPLCLFVCVRFLFSVCQGLCVYVCFFYIFCLFLLLIFSQSICSSIYLSTFLSIYSDLPIQSTNTLIIFILLSFCFPIFFLFPRPFNHFRLTFFFLESIIISFSQLPRVVFLIISFPFLPLRYNKDDEF